MGWRTASTEMWEAAMAARGVGDDEPPASQCSIQSSQGASPTTTVCLCRACYETSDKHGRLRTAEEVQTLRDSRLVAQRGGLKGPCGRCGAKDSVAFHSRLFVNGADKEVCAACYTY